MIKKIIFTILLCLLTTKVFSYEILGGLGYGQVSHKSTKKNSVTANVDVYAPLLFKGLHLGIGSSYLVTQLGSSTQLGNGYSLYSPMEEKNINISLIPLYFTLKYEYFFDKDFSVFLSGKLGVAMGNKKYYSGETEHIDGSNNKIKESDKLEIFGNRVFGISTGISFFNNYMISLSYENIAVKNMYYSSDYDVKNKDNITKVDYISLKLSYVFRK